MTFRIAWQNVTHKKLRALASISGVAFSIVLMFMQLGIFSAAERSADLVYRRLDFDIALVSPQYVHMASAGTVPRDIAARARDVVGVSSASPLHITFSLVRNVEDKLRRGILLMGVDPDNAPFKDREILQQTPLLYEPETMLVDREARGEYGPREIGMECDVGAGRLEIVGKYTLGTGFIAGADAVTSEQTFCLVTPNRRTDQPSMVLVKLTGGSPVEIVASRLRGMLGSDVVVHSREEIESIEKNYFVNVKPIGIMFRSGVIVGFLVGAVTLYQILATQVTNNMGELATLKALGYRDNSVYGVVIQEGIIYAIVGYFPALAGGFALYYVLRAGANVPVYMTYERAVVVFFLTIIMCVASSVLAARKVRTADPADLFG